LTDHPQPRGLFETIVRARLQVLQSKRLMLASSERRLRLHKVRALRERVERLHEEMEDAQSCYRSVLIKFGTPGRPDYWPVAYARLVELADNLAEKLRIATVELPPERRFELAVEVEVIEDLLKSWRDSLRGSIGEAIA
jgi:hypothetical protein